ncbi:MAG: AAA family ATPase, partial [Anaerolineales bacterium]|nr:AAA family ATPase [Anaerolineales bacterium]
MTVLPSGTVTFLFTDIEGSTDLLKKLGDAYATLLGDQREILRACLTQWNGQEVDTQGDAFFYSFPRATEAVSAAVEAQQAFSSHGWPEGVEVRVRMGLHTGEPSTWEEGYVGMDVHRAARIAHVGHGGQVLLSETTAPLVRDELPEGVSLLNLGRHRLKDMRRPERIHQLVIEGLQAQFPPLSSLEALPPEVPIEMGVVKLPSFLEEVEEVPLPLFVGRERELGQLDGFLQKALDGHGGLAFVIGGPGRGKTALLEAFSRRASEEKPKLLVAWGECSAYTGMGDPYLPFRQIMGMLTGDLESRWAARRISRQEATRLWEAMLVAAREVVEVSPDLIDVFVSGRGLLSRVRTAVEGSAPWIERLASLTKGDRPSTSGLDQRNLFDQVEVVLAEIADRKPMVLVLDDLQWVDSASIDLLFHLGRRLAGRRILIVGAYRPEEIALGRGGEPHPLQTLLAELKRQYGEVWIDLGKVQDEEGRSFVESYLDSEPNQLSEGFRKSLFMHTGGHPLFTVELLRDLQERGDLILDEEGRWVEGNELDWSILPARVEGVIEERIGRLEEALRETL